MLCRSVITILLSSENTVLQVAWLFAIILISLFYSFVKLSFR